MKYALVILSIVALSCTKYEVNNISGNVAPNDTTISNTIKNGYISRLYIKLLDRKPDSIEFNTALALLNENPNSQQKRKEVINIIKQNDEYHHVLWKLIRELLLDGADTSEINDEYRDLYEDWTNATGNAKQVLEYEWKRMEQLIDGAERLAAGTTTWEELQKSACYNAIYDDLNMGTENFVVSVFQSLIHRYPSNQELSESKSMVNGTASILFLQPGNTKEDFLDIFFNARSYYEGQALYVFKTNLFRDPNSVELDHYTEYYLSNGSFEALYFELLSSENYFFQ